MQIHFNLDAQFWVFIYLFAELSKKGLISTQSSWSSSSISWDVAIFRPRLLFLDLTSVSFCSSFLLLGECNFVVFINMSWEFCRHSNIDPRELVCCWVLKHNSTCWWRSYCYADRGLCIGCSVSPLHTLLSVASTFQSQKPSFLLCSSLQVWWIDWFSFSSCCSWSLCIAAK